MNKKEEQNFSEEAVENTKTDNLTDVTDADCHDNEEQEPEIIKTAESEKQEIADNSKEIELQNKIGELNDKYIRLYSEFDNFRKRSLREKIDLSRTASEDVIKDILPVLDDFDRAVAAKNESGESLVEEGILLIISKLKKILANKGLKEMTSIGEGFDTDFHEAITSVPATSEEQKNTIIDEIEKGYLLNDKVIRFAKVVTAL